MPDEVIPEAALITSAQPGDAAVAAPPAPDPESVPGAAAPARRRPRDGWRAAVRPATLLAPAGWAATAMALFFCYLRLSRTTPINSDGASNALQAWDMLHGNMLLHGWSLSDVSFYTTELPQYMLVELARGLGPQDVHIAAAVTYTLLVLIAAALARGTATGREAAVRMLIAGGIMLAPAPGTAARVLLLSPDHVGTSVPVLLTWLLLDRAPRRWYVPVAAAALLAWALVADGLVVIIGVLPLLSVCAVRVYQARIVRRQPLRSSWYELSLGAAALVAVEAAQAALAAITAVGGFRVSGVGSRLAPLTDLMPHALLALHGLLVLFGADFTSQKPGLGSGLAMLHLVGLGLAARAVGHGVRRFFADRDLVTSLLLAGILVSLAAYLVGYRAVNIQSTREISAVLPLSAVLAARLLAGRLDRARMVPALALVLAGYCAGLGWAAARPPAPDPSQQLGSWLAGRHLDYGLAGYWEANRITLGSGGRAVLRSAAGRPVGPGGWETSRSWYDPRRYRATFVVLFPGGLSQASAVASFGRPARVYQDGGYTVLAWNKNLLTELGCRDYPAGIERHASRRRPDGDGAVCSR